MAFCSPRLGVHNHNLAGTFTGSIRTKAHLTFWRKRSMGISRDCPNFLSTPISVAVWLSGYVVGQINKVTLRRAGLMLRWVTVRGVHRLGVQPSHPGQLSLVIPPWVDEISTSERRLWLPLGKKRRVLRNSRPCDQDC